MDKPYLNNQPWSAITRDERTYCAHLYFLFKNEPKKLVDLIKKSRILEKKGFKNTFEPDGGNWELGYEVCFYRDLLKKYGLSVREKGLPEKRTFDLCLFSDNEIVIIEAKAHENLGLKQLISFSQDRAYVSKALQLTGSNKMNVFFVLLASSDFYDKQSFALENGLGRKYILENKLVKTKEPKDQPEKPRKLNLDALISWKQVSETCDKVKDVPVDIDKTMMVQADNL